MRLRAKTLATFAIATLLVSVSATLALRSGADAGVSGGRAADGMRCTSCHQPFNHGLGGVDLLGAPRRYRAGVEYDLTVHLFDPDPDTDGGGYELSAESATGHEGMLSPGAIHSKYAGFGGQVDYVTHTAAGVSASASAWTDNGGAFDYQLQWQAPMVDAGPVTFFVTSNIVDSTSFFSGTRYKATHVTSHFAIPGDAEGDTDLDLADFAALQRCFSGEDAFSDDVCAFVDMNANGAVALEDLVEFVSSLTGPTAEHPAGYVLADAVRGGKLYDRWWVVNGAAAPTTDHPLWATRPDPDSNLRTGSATWRCKECHGWDYKGVDGAYGDGSHRTGFPGVFGSTLNSQELFDLLKTSPLDTLNGHALGSAGMSDADLWDVVKMTLEGTIDTDQYIGGPGLFFGNPTTGDELYRLFDGADACSSCHGADGMDSSFDFAVGAIAQTNPWEFLHKVRYGHPGAPMPSFELLGWDARQAAHVGAFAATLPTE